MKLFTIRFSLGIPLFLLAGLIIYGQDRKEMAAQTVTFSGQECPITTLEDGTVMIDTSEVTASILQVQIDATGQRVTKCRAASSSQIEATPFYTER